MTLTPWSQPGLRSDPPKYFSGVGVGRWDHAGVEGGAGQFLVALQFTGDDTSPLCPSCCRTCLAWNLPIFWTFDPRALLVGSVSLVGGIGTTLAWCLISSSGWVSRRTGDWHCGQHARAHHCLHHWGAHCQLPRAGTQTPRRPMTPGWTLAWHTTPTAAKRALITGVLRAWLWLNLALLLGAPDEGALVTPGSICRFCRQPDGRYRAAQPCLLLPETVCPQLEKNHPGPGPDL